MKTPAPTHQVSTNTAYKSTILKFETNRTVISYSYVFSNDLTQLPERPVISIVPTSGQIILNEWNQIICFLLENNVFCHEI